MSENLIVTTSSQLQELIKSAVKSELDSYFQQKQETKEKRPVVYRTRAYVKNLLHISYPTLQKYSHPESGLLKPVYFGRRVLYIEDELNLAIPKIKALLDKDRAA